MNNRELYSKYLERLRIKLIQKYDELGLRASGKYEEALETEITGNGNTLIMWGANHAYYMEHGRGTGKFPPRKAIEDWIERKQGIPQEWKDKKKQWAYVIARKIATEGITVPNEHNKGEVIQSVVDDFLANDLYEMLDELGIVWGKQIESDVINILKTAA